MLLLNLCFPIAFFQPCMLPSMASCKILSVKMVLYGFCTANQLSNFSYRMKNTMHRYRMANQLLVLDHVGIGYIDPFAFVITPSNREFEARHNHSILESYSEYHRQGFDFPDPQEWPPSVLAYTTKILIKEAKRCSFNLM